MDTKTKQWIKAVLANDEASSDDELRLQFIEEGGLTHEEADAWIALRSQYTRDVLCDAEPGDKEPDAPYKLPTFNGYTVDRRLREFRKAEPGKGLEFIPFDSTEGQKLLTAMKDLTDKVQANRV